MVGGGAKKGSAARTSGLALQYAGEPLRKDREAWQRADGGPGTVTLRQSAVNGREAP